MKKVIFLDRDGTINVDRGYVHTPAAWEFTPQAPRALKLLQQAGFGLAVVTNQSGIARGIYSTRELEVLHQHVQALLSQHGVTIDAFAFCPHRPAEGCDCRKPKTGMRAQIERRIHAVDYPSSWTIGDKPDDVQFGKALRTRTVLLRSRHWTEHQLAHQPDYIANALYEAATFIVHRR